MLFIQSFDNMFLHRLFSNVNEIIVNVFEGIPPHHDMSFSIDENILEILSPFCENSEH